MTSPSEPPSAEKWIARAHDMASLGLACAQIARYDEEIRMREKCTVDRSYQAYGVSECWQSQHQRYAPSVPLEEWCAACRPLYGTLCARKSSLKTRNYYRRKIEAVLIAECHAKLAVIGKAACERALAQVKP